MAALAAPTPPSFGSHACACSGMFSTLPVLAGRPCRWVWVAVPAVACVAQVALSAATTSGVTAGESASFPLCNAQARSADKHMGKL